MSFIRLSDEKPIPAMGFAMILLYLFGGMLAIRACAPFPPQVQAGK